MVSSTPDDQNLDADRPDKWSRSRASEWQGRLLGSVQTIRLPDPVALAEGVDQIEDPDDASSHAGELLIQLDRSANQLSRRLNTILTTSGFVLTIVVLLLDQERAIEVPAAFVAACLALLAFACGFVGQRYFIGPTPGVEPDAHEVFVMTVRLGHLVFYRSLGSLLLVVATIVLFVAALVPGV